MADVDLVVNCFERSYRKVLAPGFFPRIAAGNAHDFAMRTAVINNVDDRGDARRRAQALIQCGELDRFRFVADCLDDALATCGLTRDELEPMPYFNDFGLVAVTLDGPDWMLMWDADLRMRDPIDWVTPAIELMDRDRRVMAANPNWPVDNLADFTLESDGPFALGQGFTDQVFLVRRSEFARPIYRRRSISHWRYPLSYRGKIFESRVDAHMRHAGRLRATHRGATYEQEVLMGTSWPDRSLFERAMDVRNRAAIGTLRRLPWRPRHLRQL